MIQLFSSEAACPLAKYVVKFLARFVFLVQETSVYKLCKLNSILRKDL